MLIAKLSRNQYPIEQLAAETGVTVRTIRFYQQEGLLDPLGKQGVRLYYGPGEVSRVRLIRALQERRLRLREIRKRLARLDDVGVAAELRRLEAEAREETSAASCAREVLDAQVARSSSEAPARSTYDRITITPDIELHVRGPLSQFEHTLVRQLLQEADRIFQSHTLEHL